MRPKELQLKIEAPQNQVDLAKVRSEQHHTVNVSW